jgi:hypothetical protein
MKRITKMKVPAVEPNTVPSATAKQNEPKKKSAAALPHNLRTSKSGSLDDSAEFAHRPAIENSTTAAVPNTISEVIGLGGLHG